MLITGPKFEFYKKLMADMPISDPPPFEPIEPSTPKPTTQKPKPTTKKVSSKQKQL
jgi:hypothetical protein